MKKNCAVIVILILLCFSDLSLAQISFKAGTFFDTKLTEQTLNIYPIVYESRLGLILGLEIYLMSRDELSSYSGIELRIKNATINIPEGHDINGKMVYSGYDIFDLILGVPFVFQYSFPLNEKLKIIPLLGFDIRYTIGENNIHFIGKGSVENIQRSPWYMEEWLLSVTGKAGFKLMLNKFFIEFNVTPELNKYPMEHVGKFSFISYNFLIGIKGSD